MTATGFMHRIYTRTGYPEFALPKYAKKPSDAADLYAFYVEHLTDFDNHKDVICTINLAQIEQTLNKGDIHYITHIYTR